MPFLSVVVPAYNEEKTVGGCLRRVLCQPQVHEVIVVDDCSTDQTASVVEALATKDQRVRLTRLPENRGKGAALRVGFESVSGEIVIVQDADLEYDPSDYEKVLAPILSGHADIVFGSRFLGGSSRRVLYFWHCVGNKWLTLLSNCFTGLNLSDIETCYKAMRSTVLRRLCLQECRFGIEPELVAKLARLKLPVYEVPISYHGRTYEQGKKVGWRDGFRAIWCIFKYGILS